MASRICTRSHRVRRFLCNAGSGTGHRPPLPVDSGRPGAAGTRTVRRKSTAITSVPWGRRPPPASRLQYGVLPPPHRRGHASSSPDAAAPDHFAALGIDRDFATDPAALKRAYLTLMAAAHPDVAAHRPSGGPAAHEVTLAYNIIKQPHPRACHLLELAGFPVEEGSAGGLVDGPFLMEIMDIREAVEDAADLPAVLRRLFEENNGRMEESCRALEAHFREEDFETARKKTAELSYWVRINEELRERMDEI